MDSHDYDKRVSTAEAAQRVIRTYVFSEIKKNPLEMDYDFKTYLLIKKKWIPARFWNFNEVGNIKHDQKGISLPSILYYYLHDKPDKLISLALYIMEEDKFYRTTIMELEKWIEKKNCQFDDIYGADVMGIPKTLFVDDENKKVS